jgi:hypothetical protein
VFRRGVDEKSILVIFLCTVWPIVPSKFLVTRTSRKCKAAFSSLSIVKLMFWWTSFRRFGNSCSYCFPCRHTTEVFSMYLHQRIALFTAVLVAVCSKSSTASTNLPLPAPRESYGLSVLLLVKPTDMKNVCGC